MFLLHTVHDTIRISADSLAIPTITAIQNEIDSKYPNRVIMDVGLVIGRYETKKISSTITQQQQRQQRQQQPNKNSRQVDISNKSPRNTRPRNGGGGGDGGLLRISHGVCITGDGTGSCHHECTFQLIIFRPFVNEVCMGYIERSDIDGIHVSLGFFHDIFIPAYWMLNPSYYDTKTGLWIWTPQYDDEDNNDNNEENENEKDLVKDANNIKNEMTNNTKEDTTTTENNNNNSNNNRYVMEIGSEIRFKVKAIHFTQITNTAKGMQATTISMASSSANPTNNSNSHQHQQQQHEKSNMDIVNPNTAASSSFDILPPSLSSQHQQQQQQNQQQTSLLQRRRSSSVSSVHEVGGSALANHHQALPSTMQIIGSICEDGLGLTSWWTSEPDEEVEDDDNENEREETMIDEEDEDVIEEDYGMDEEY